MKYPVLPAVVAFFVITTAATAQQADADDWTGFYAGLGFAVSQTATEQYSPAQQTYDGYLAAEYGGSHPFGLLQIGGDVQVDQFVVGLRLQHAMTGSDGDEFMKVDELVSASVKSLTTVTARAGYLFQPTVLGYVNAGLAAGHYSYGSVDERWELVADEVNGTRYGATVGAGIELLVHENVSLFAEYNHAWLAAGRETFDYGADSFPPEWTYEYTHQLGAVQVGANFRF